MAAFRIQSWTGGGDGRLAGADYSYNGLHGANDEVWIAAGGFRQNGVSIA